MTVDLVSPKGKVIIRKDEPNNKTNSGILLGKNDRVRSNSGLIVSVPDGSSYQDGQRIFFNPQISNTINFKEENLVVIYESDILAVV